MVTPTVTVCEPSFQNRTSLTLGEVCGDYGSTGFCNSSNSACMPSSLDTTWRCRCIMGYFRDFRQDECVAAPTKLFNDEKITCNIETGIGSGVDVCVANLTSSLLLYTTEIERAILRPQTDKFELKFDRSQTYFKILTKTTITGESTFVFILHATLKVGDSIGSVNVSDVTEVHLNFIQSSTVDQKFFTHITEDTSENQTVYRIPIENFKNPGSMEINATNLFKLDSNSGIVYTNKFIGDEILSDQIGKEIIETIVDSSNGKAVAYLYVIIMRSEYKIDMEEGIDLHKKKIGTFLFYSPNITISIDGVSNSLFNTKDLSLHRGEFDFDFDGNSEQREYRFNIKVNVPSYVTSSFTGQLISKVVVRITDKNDLAPTFTKETYEIQLLLSALSNVLIGFVSADDNDTVGQIAYEIESKYQNYFKVNDVGAITTTIPVTALSNITGFDRATESVRVKVIATDGVQKANATVLIQVTSPPEENLQMIFKGQILEGEPIGTNITSIYVTGYSDYQFAQVNEGEKYFKLNSTTGTIDSNLVFDRETKDEVKIVVMASKGDALTCALSVLGELVVTVLDINDNSPVFTQSEYQGSVLENNADTVIQTTTIIRATDADIGENANVKYLLQNHQSIFAINETTAEIRTLVELDRESVSVYNLSVVATDGEKSGTAMVVINVLDINDNSPSFNAVYRFAISEGTTIDTSLGQVTATDIDDGKNSRIIYYIIGGRGYFQINRETGEIVVKHALDRETDTSFRFEVSARDDGDTPRSSSVEVNVTVTDINDNTPAFNESYLQTSRDEDVDCSTSLHRVVANDIDDGANKDIEYRLLSETDKFVIGTTTGIISCKPGYVIDFETTTRYEVSVEAKDKGSEPKSSSATVVIEINDVNDNDPEFIGGVNNISINSVIFDGDAGKPIMVIPVEDKDSGANGDITLDISGNFTGFVTVDSQTNILQTKGGTPPSTGIYLLQITAKDRGTPSRQSVASLTIQIMSSIDISNKITFTKEDIRLAITEGPDSLNYTNNNLEYFINNKNGKTMKYSIVTTQDTFAINENNGQISLNKTLDRETKSEHFFVVRAKNEIHSDDSDLGLIKIVVLDINDNTPVFKKKKYIYIVQEDVDIDYSFSTKIEATDADDPAKTKLIYKIKKTKDCANFFRINENTGLISLETRLDYERWSFCKFDIEVTDSDTSPINTATVEVDVNVKDVNDNSPVFDQPSTYEYQLQIREDKKIGDQIASSARVNDADDRGNGDIKFKIISDAGCPFTVEKELIGNESVPVFKVKTELDYETTKNYRCILIAEDQPERPQDVQSARATFSINITDVNDNAPIVNLQSQPIEIERSIEPDTEILSQISATDADSGVNAKLKFILDELSLNTYFLVNENTGAISIKNSLATLQKDVVKLHIIVEDSGSPALSASTIVTISITDANFRPNFIPTEVLISLEEEHEINDDIFTANAFDTIGGSVVACSCTYRLETGTDHFTINNVTGVVQMIPNTVLDREKRKTILVLIYARDHDSVTPKDSEPLRLTVNVTDINDQSPVFNRDFSFDILQVAPVGTFIGKVEADDKDEGIHAVTHYSVENVTLPDEQPNDNGRNLIRIDKSNGTMFLNGVINVNASSDFTILVKVKAVDSLDDNKIGYTDVRLNVKFDNPNKHQPTCKNEHIDLDVVNKKENATLLSINGTDMDTSINGEITYSIIDGNFRDVLSVESSTGKVTLNYALNKAFEGTIIPNQLRLIVQVTDKGISSRTGTCTVSIDIIGQPETCVEQSKLANVQNEKNVFLYSMSAMAAVLAVFILFFLYCTYRYCTLKDNVYGSHISNQAYKPTFFDKQRQFKPDFEPSNYRGDNISDIIGYEQPISSANQSAYSYTIHPEEPEPDYHESGDNSSEEIDFEKIRKEEKKRAFKRSESSRKDRHQQIYGDDKSAPQDFLRSRQANFMRSRPDDGFPYEDSNSEFDVKHFSHI